MLKAKRHLLLVVAVLAGIYFAFERSELDEQPVSAAGSSGSDLALAFEERRSAYQVTGSGVVARVLADDNDGSRHQRFVLRLVSDQTVLVAHNVDLAPRSASVQAAEQISEIESVSAPELLTDGARQIARLLCRYAGALDGIA